MEGLIPMVFRAIKRNKIRSQYRCLSVGATQTYNLADFYDDHQIIHHDHDHEQNGNKLYSTEMQPRGEGHRRRFSSAGEMGINGGYNNNFIKYDHHDESNGGIVLVQLIGS
ncbi:uncharacterized protein LOC130806378 isoform X1 [Amaranthus tricolor]|uniref:uncharacterized protein LOC130806378 isoform X1 n=1 Tax=Amaranthus tricolor TaxID=29722 RepID=UPI002585839E|nr:uncharacterized protein LOC130806378 isoform X1 [Amaranthus tricolor]